MRLEPYRIPLIGLSVLIFGLACATGVEPSEHSSPATDLPKSAGALGGFRPDSVPGTAIEPGCIALNDCDGDGYVVSLDCNDNDATINPEAYDFPDDGVDNDCDGVVDNPVTECAAATESGSARDFARAADLCAQRSVTLGGTKFDPLIKAEFGTLTAGFITHSDAVGVLEKFGENKPRRGSTLFLLQSGPIGSTDPRKSKPYDLTQVANACKVIPLREDDCKTLRSGTSDTTDVTDAAVQDWAEVRLTVQVPSNAKAMNFDFAYFSTEFSEYWHSAFNDAFWALVSSSKLKGANVARDSRGYGVTVNSGFFQLCPRGPASSDLGKPDALANCVGVEGDATQKVFGTLKGTGFDGAGIGSKDGTVQGFGTGWWVKRYIYGGGSGWLTTRFGVEPGERLVIRFIVHDTSDGRLDSAAIVDNIRWEMAPPKIVTGETVRPLS